MLLDLFYLEKVVAHVETCGKAMGKTSVQKAKFGHLVLELSMPFPRCRC